MSAKKRGPGRPPKNKNKNKSKPTPHTVPKGFWRQVGAIFVLVIATILFLGLFGIGGVLPVEFAKLARFVFGWVAFIIPLIFFFQTIQVFRKAESIPGVIWAATILFVAFFAGLFQLMILDPRSIELAKSGIGGGVVGWVVANNTLNFVNLPVAALIFVVMLLVLVMFVFSISPKALVDAISKFFNNEEETFSNNKALADRIDSMEKEPSKLKISGLKSKKKDLEKEDTEKAPKRGFGRLMKSVDSSGEDLEIKKPTKIASEPVATPAINNSDWKLPDIKLLSNKRSDPDAGNEKMNAQIIEDTLHQFNISGTVEQVNVGPRVAQYCLKPQRGIKLSRITELENSFKLNLAVESIRIEAPVPGQPYVGIEIPNRKPAFVNLRSILETSVWNKSKAPLSFGVGLNVTGEPIVLNLAELPHLLIAGTTGSGKSVMMNALIMSLLFRNSPDDLKLVLVDPKGNEMVQYSDMPHLAAPIIAGTANEELHKLTKTLLWLTDEMEKRYDLFKERGGVKKIADFKKRYPDEKLPNIVLILDEYTDLVDSLRSTERETVTTLIQRIAQKGRAAGIHEVIMMQAPRAKYIQGPLKANIPAGFAFAVRSKMESQQIINSSGADQLMGKGDMLMITAKIKKPRRVQAANVSDEEVDRVVTDLKMQSPPQYDENLLARLNEKGASAGLPGSESRDSEYGQAVEVVINEGKASTTLLQRRLRIGYSKAARIMEEMEDNGIIGPADGSRPREVLVSSVEDIQH